MTTFETLPIVLVSAATESTASSVISELINDDITEQYVQESQSGDRVWRLVNKYYRADVRVHALVDGEPLILDPNTVEAHIIHVTKDELVAGAQCAEKRSERASEAWRRAGVRVVVGECARHAALDAWAAAQRAEFVPRRSVADTRDTRDALAAPFAPSAGLQLARDALHAHVWPNLVRAGALPLPPVATSDSESGASSESESESGAAESDSSAAELRAVERAEAFALALGALGACPRGAELPAAPRDVRFDRAEEIVTAFCRALGLDPDLDPDLDLGAVQ